MAGDSSSEVEMVSSHLIPHTGGPMTAAAAPRLWPCRSCGETSMIAVGVCNTCYPAVDAARGPKRGKFGRAVKGGASQSDGVTDATGDGPHPEARCSDGRDRVDEADGTPAAPHLDQPTGGGGSPDTQDLDPSPPAAPRRKPSAAPMRKPAAADGHGGSRLSDNVAAGVSSHQHPHSSCVDFGPETEFERRKLLRVMTDLCDTTVSSYQISHAQLLVILLVLDGEHWRAHNKHTFRYTDGAWDQTEYLEILPWDMLTALEGLPVKLGTWQGDGEPPEEWSPPEWTWAAIKPRLHSHLSRDGDSAQSLRAVVWRGNWSLRCADMLNSLKKACDAGSFKVSLTELRARKCSTPKPRSRGVALKDVNLNEDWQEAPKSPDNNCYFRVPYSYHWIEAKLTRFLEDLYHDNEDVFKLELAFFKLAFMRIRSGKMKFKIGSGGDGKHMEAVLEQNLLGFGNCHYMDCSCLLERSEFKKSGGLAWNQSIVRIQEIDGAARFLSDIWKRFIVDEEIDCGENFGFTETLKFGESMKDQKLNFENIHVIDDAGGGAKVLAQLSRRVVCCRMGKAEGRFKKIPRDELEDFLSHPFTAVPFLRVWCIPFFLKHTETDVKTMINDMKSVSQRLFDNTEWIARCLSRSKEPPPGDNDGRADAYDKIIADAHAGTPMRPFIKEYVINKLPWM
ncbi:unnamed protein product [Prorocentrum cordatum]|uniref:Uncharacterized protein n=1 Tax=Prorocentrum cordatum TaxID=2364126 RepID=A0ABN9XVC0_9DINO|nr:unnamed protein product [Polarella glacialis]